MRGFAGGTDAPHQFVSSVDVDAGVSVGEALAHLLNPKWSRRRVYQTCCGELGKLAAGFSEGFNLMQQGCCRLMLLLLALQTPGFARAVEVTWMYDVVVPVADQTAAARLDAGRAGLLQVLTRITGMSSIPDSEALQAALATPDRYYNQFGFEKPPVPADGEQEVGTQEQPALLLRMQFVPVTVFGLVRQAGLPIWRSERPMVIAWLVADAGGDRRILGADSNSPVVRSLTGRALERGVPLQLPMMDLQDQLEVEPGAVWGRLSRSLVPASERYGAEIILIGRLQAGVGGLWSGSWEFWIDGEVIELDEQNLAEDALGVAVVDRLADDLVERYAVQNRGVQELRLGVSGVQGAADYAGVMRYLGALEFVDDVRVARVEGNRLELGLVTTADSERLLTLFEADGLLLADDLNRRAGGAIELVWRQR